MRHFFRQCHRSSTQISTRGRSTHFPNLFFSDQKVFLENLKRGHGFWNEEFCIGEEGGGAPRAVGSS